MMLSGPRRSLCLTTLTSGFSAVDRLLGRVDLRDADALGVVDHLALQVGEVDDVVVDDPERADAGRREVERRRRAEAAGAEQQHLGVEQLLLALDADLVEQQVARVAVALLGAHEARNLDLVAAVLPEREAAGHRLDVLVAEVLDQRARGPGGALARGAVQDHGLALSGATPSIRDSRWLLGTWRAPGMWPVAHSSSWRTSITSAPSLEAAHARRRIDLVDPVLDLAENLRSGRDSSLKLLKGGRDLVFRSIACNGVSGRPDRPLGNASAARCCALRSTISPPGLSREVALDQRRARCGWTSSGAGPCWSSSGTSAARTRSARCPYMKAWHERYAEQGLRVIGVHSAGFEPSDDPDGGRLPRSSAWGSSTRSWSTSTTRSGRSTRTSAGPPATCGTPSGCLFEYHFGEGAYAETELAIQELLGVEREPVAPVRPEDEPERAARAAERGRAGPYSGPYEAGGVWGVFEGSGVATVNGDELDDRPPRRLRADRARASHRGRARARRQRRAVLPGGLLHARAGRPGLA